jgi:hypothetical protein
VHGAQHGLPLESVEMKTFSSYMRWLSTGIPDGAKLLGAGRLQIKEPDRAADVGRGAETYANLCAALRRLDSVPAAGTYVSVVHGDRTPSPIKLSHHTDTDAGAFAARLARRRRRSDPGERRIIRRRNLDVRPGSCEGITDPWPTRPAALRCSGQGQARTAVP